MFEIYSEPQAPIQALGANMPLQQSSEHDYRPPFDRLTDEVRGVTHGPVDV